MNQNKQVGNKVDFYSDPTDDEVGTKVERSGDAIALCKSGVSCILLFAGEKKYVG